MQTAKRTDKFLTPGTLINDKSVAAALGISRASVWNLAKNGRITPVKLSSQTTRFRADDILEIIEGV